MSLQDQNECHRQIQELVQADLAGEATPRASHLYSSPLLLVQKRGVNVAPRMCLDLRSQNFAVQPAVVS